MNIICVYRLRHFLHGGWFRGPITDLSTAGWVLWLSQTIHFYILPYKSKAAWRSLAYKGSKLWSNLLKETELCPSAQSFKAAYCADITGPGDWCGHKKRKKKVLLLGETGVGGDYTDLSVFHTRPKPSPRWDQFLTSGTAAGDQVQTMLSYWGLTFMGSMITLMMKNKAELGMPSHMCR